MAGTWASAGNLSAAKDATACFGTSDAGTAANGSTTHGVAGNTLDNYNGTSWSAGTGYTGKDGGGCGTQAAGLTFGMETGNTSSQAYNGTSWTAGGSLSSAVQFTAPFGTATAAVAGQTFVTKTVQKYNGTTWSTGTSTTSDHHYGAVGFGTQSSGGVSAGWDTTGAAIQRGTELYNGTSWTASGNTSAQGCIFYVHGGGGGSQNAAWFCGGETPAETGAFTTTEEFNGSTWSAGGTLNTGRRYQSWACAGATGFTAGGSTSAGYTSLIQSAEKYSGGPGGAAAAQLAKVGGVALASIAKYSGIAKASIKKVGGLTIQ